MGQDYNKGIVFKSEENKGSKFSFCICDQDEEKFTNPIFSHKSHRKKCTFVGDNLMRD